MAVDTKKLLPTSSIVKYKPISAGLLKPVDKKYQIAPYVEGIKIKVIKIDKVLKNNLLLQSKQEQVKRKEKEKEKFSKREEQLEKPKDGGIKIPKPTLNIPKLGIVDVINRYLFFTALGYLFERIRKFGSQISDFIKSVAPVADFIETFSVNIFKGLVDFIDWGYKTYDKVKEFVKQIGGEPFQKTFDQFSSQLNTFINLALIAGMSAMGGSDFGLGDKGKQKAPSVSGSRQGVKPKVTTSGGRTLGRPDLRFPLRDRVEVTTSDSRTLGKPDTKTSLRRKAKVTTSGGKIFGRTGSKIAGRVFGRIPIIGGLVDFLFALWSGEPVGRAAAKAVGATIGSALGTFVPVPFVGTILGGVLGDIVGGALYDTLVNTSKKSQKNIKKKSSGGRVSTTRSGQQTQKPIRRTLKVAPIKPRKIQPPKSQPGKDVGGFDKIQLLFPDPLHPAKKDLKPDPNARNPLQTLIKTSEILKEIPFLGSIMGTAVDLAMGQRPDDKIITSFGDSIGYFVESIVNSKVNQSLSNITSALFKFADGGKIQLNEVSNDKNIGTSISQELSNQFRSIFNSRLNEIFKTITGEYAKKDYEGSVITVPSTELPDGSTDGMGVQVSSDSKDFWLLATAAMFENSDPQGAADVAQVIYNRTQYPAWNAPTIRKAILNPGQFQPVSQYGGASAWGAIKTKEDAIKFSRSHGKTQQQLERVAAALLDKKRQQSAREFVGPRDSFRATWFEDKNNHLANETEKRRHGHVFGFEPGGAMIGKFKAGKLSAAVIDEQIKGSVKFGEKKGNLQIAQKIAQGMGLKITSGLRGPRYPGDRSLHISGRAMDFSNDAVGNGTPEQLAFAKKMISEFGSSLEQLIYTPLGFGISKGKKVPLSYWGEKTNAGHYNHVHVGFEGGGLIEKNQPRRDTSSLRTRASYEDMNQSTVLVQPIIITKTVPIPKASYGLSTSPMF